MTPDQGVVAPDQAHESAALTAEVAALLATSRIDVEGAYRARIDRLPSSARRVLGYHRGWWSATGDVAVSPGGKAIRPAFVFAAGAAVGGVGRDGCRSELALAAAVCIELVHDWSLIHDDVMDADRYRRHRPTVWAQYGVPRAVLAGDLLLAIALGELRRLGDREGDILAETLETLCLGQWDDLDFTARMDVTMPEVITMAAGKTGALIAAACRLGALVEGASAAQVDAVGSFGHDIGIAFQIVDDLLGIWGAPERTGKPVGADILERKRSVPIVAAATANNRAAADLRRILADDAPPTVADVPYLTNLIQTAGGRDVAEAEVARWTTSARAHLDRGFGPDGAAQLRALAGGLIQRDC